jgi:hypothetical protein
MMNELLLDYAPSPTSRIALFTKPDPTRPKSNCLTRERRSKVDPKINGYDGKINKDDGEINADDFMGLLQQKQKNLLKVRVERNRISSVQARLSTRMKVEL